MRPWLASSGEINSAATVAAATDSAAATVTAAVTAAESHVWVAVLHYAFCVLT